ncbi:MAG TPA: F0F1 ATP synthase subunit A [Verrucomicrobiae bacterium]|jgi:F-type H+-transporting ATPase subunit a|nr:F0F1 ATP synthase subunit A [Verrucomicrobiae bacterium]
MNEHDIGHAIQEAGHHAAGAAHAVAHEAHELPNFITILHNMYPEAGWVEFLEKWENVIFSLMAVAIISTTAILAARRSKLVPDSLQNFWEAVVEGINGFACGILGPEGPKHVPFLGTIFLYILLMNWSGLIPLFKAPTSAWSTTLAVGISTMVYVQITGIREQGLANYIKHLAGNPQNIFGIILIPLMFVLNIILELAAVPFSLSLRLFANISSEDRLLFKFAELNVMFKYLPFFFQLFANVLSIIFSMVQAFVFMLLSTVYISLVLPHEEHGHDEHEGQAASHAHAH